MWGIKPSSIPSYEMLIIQEKQLEVALKTTLLIDYGAALFAIISLIFTLLLNPSDKFNLWFQVISIPFLFNFTMLWICVRRHAKKKLSYKFYLTTHTIGGLAVGIVWGFYPIVFSEALQMGNFLADILYMCMLIFALAWGYPFMQPPSTLVSTMVLSYLVVHIAFPFEGVGINLYLVLSSFGMFAYVLLMILLFVMAFTFIQWTRKNIHLEKKSHLLSVFLLDYEESATDWVWQTNKNGHIDYASNRMLETINLQVDALNTIKFIGLFKETNPETKQLEQLLSQKKKFVKLKIPISIDRQQHIFCLTGKPIFNTTNEFIGFRGVGSDVSKIVEMEKTASHREFYDAFIQISSMLSHDFNNLLASIMIRIEFMKKEKISYKERKEYADESLFICKKAANITSQMLAYSKKHSLQPKNISVNEIFDILKEEVKYKDISIKVIAAEELYVWSDETLLFTSLTNIINNAIRAVNNKGAIYVHIKKIAFLASEHELEVGDYIHISIEDTGKGFTQQELNGLAFEPFYTKNRESGGSGLGLSMVQGFAKQSGGNATIENGKHGAKINLYFPSGQKEDSHLEKSEVQNQNAHILLVEDNADVSNLLIEYLKLSNTQVWLAENVSQAVKLFSENKKINLIISDFMLPDGNGSDVMKATRSINPDIAFIYISGYLDTPFDTSTSKEIILTKPFVLSDLSKAINTVMSKKKTPADYL